MLPGLHVRRWRGGLPVPTPPRRPSDGDGYSPSAVFACVCGPNAAGGAALRRVDTVGLLEARQQSLKREERLGPPALTLPPSPPPS